MLPAVKRVSGDTCLSTREYPGTSRHNTIQLLQQETPDVILTRTELKGHWRLFVLVSSFLYNFSGYVC